MGPQHHSKLPSEQAPHNIRESLRDGTEVKLEASDLKELEQYFTALEESRRNLQELLQDQEEQHAMELRALEREREQERAEWERERVEREEALLTTILSVAVSRQKLIKELRSQPATLVSTKPLGGTALRSSRKFWFFKKHQAITDVAPQDAPSSSACKHMEADQLDLKQLMELEKRVREAERKKHQKALAKAQKKARKAEKQNKAKKTQDDDQVKDSKPKKRYWQRSIFTLGCAASSVED
ncbi:M protein, serotype 2.1-like [Sardina pilchardus]|uniref:M protein, serotype 2.1-like n=1 Tax=Sardina pilchardus TaxID=27697 RepID=UPI002E148221